MNKSNKRKPQPDKVLEISIRHFFISLATMYILLMGATTALYACGTSGGDSSKVNWANVLLVFLGLLGLGAVGGFVVFKVFDKSNKSKQ